MIKNSLFPYIKKYLEKYIYGFNKEQFDIMVLNGKIELKKLNLRIDTINELLNKKFFPFWIKYGYIDNISISCNIMNFVGEKPLDIIINNFDIIFSPNYIYLDSTNNSKNKENKNNSNYDFFKKRYNIYNDSLKIVNYIISEEKNYIFDYIYKLIIKFFNLKNFLVNIKITNLNLRFEDDILFLNNNYSVFGIKINLIKMIFSNEGNNKKNKIYINDMNFYYNKNNIIKIPSKILIDNKNNLTKFFREIINYNKNIINQEKFLFIIQNINFFIEFGTKYSNNMNINNVYFNLNFENKIEINLIPCFLKILFDLYNFIENFRIIDKIKKYKRNNIKNLEDILNNYKLIKNIKNLKNEKNLIKNEFDKYMAFIGYEKVKRENNINDEKSNKINNYMIPINFNNNEENEIEKNNDNFYDNNLDFNFNFISPNVILNFYNNNFINFLSFSSKSNEINIFLSRNNFTFEFEISNILIITNNIFSTVNQNMPQFKYKNENNINGFNNFDNKYSNNNSNFSSIFSSNISFSNNSIRKNINNNNNNTKNNNDIYKKLNNKMNLYKAGLKESLLYKTNNKYKNHNSEIYKLNAKYIKKMKILSETLNISKNPEKNITNNNINTKVNNYKINNNNYYINNQINKKKFISFDNYNNNMRNNISKNNFSNNNDNNIINYQTQIKQINFVSRVLNKIGIEQVISNNNNLTRNSSGISKLDDSLNDSISSIINYEQIKKNSSLGKLINDYNIQKNKNINNILYNNNNYNKIKSLSPLYRNINLNNSINSNNNVNNSLLSFSNNKKTKNPIQLYTLPLIEINSDNKNELISIYFKRNFNNKENDIININLSSVKINFFKEYFFTIFNGFNDYFFQKNDIFKTNKNNKKSKKLINFLTQNINYHKVLYILRKYIYNIQLNEKKFNSKNNTIKIFNLLYYNYIKNKIINYPIINDDFESFDTNYLFSYYFSKSLEFNIYYKQFFYCFYKNNNNNNFNYQILTMIKNNNIENNIKIFYTLSFLYINYLNYEIEINDYDNIYEIFLNISEFIENKKDKFIYNINN